MKGGIVVCGTLLVFFLIGVNTSPLAIDQKKDDKPLTVVDVPAGLFEPSEDKENPVTEAKDEAKDVVETVTTANEKEKDVEPVEEGPSMFGFKFPSVVIIRRPSIFQDPFPSFQSPFFSSFGFNRRPSFPPSPMGGVDMNREKERDREPLSGEGTQQQNTSGRQNDTILVKDVIQRMHQQINNLFANLFNPDAFQMPAMPRPSFPRPFFSRPSFFGPLSGDSSELDEDVMDPEKLPDNYTNSTSETKVVDGQLVTVNKTVHKISGNNSNGFFQFSVIKVRPSAPKPTETPINIAQPSTPDTVNTVEVKKPVDEDMDPSLNEVDRVDDANQEKLSEVEINNKYEVENDENTFKPGQPQPLVQEEEVRIVPIKAAKLIQVRNPDLASDIRINNLMANSEQGRLRALVVPDEVEIFDV